ncbi:uncharacterized protein LOC142504947 [Primulina tabacum]|uniref:uncharacterized protein LOC142504947 n=1 Tax=Primulina tabacum TaxID=48773 RepID=UPI003F5967EF
MYTDMPPRMILRSIGEDRYEEEIPQPPPNQDASARVLAGMTRLLEQHLGNGARVRPEDAYERFRRMNPEDFNGTTDPFVIEGWIRSLEVIFRYMDMVDADQVRCTIYLLKGEASLWLEGAERGVNLETLTSEDFKRVFYYKYFTSDVRSRLKREFMSLHQEHWSVAEFVQKFDRGCHFVPLIANDAAEKLRHFLDGLRPTILRDVNLGDPIVYTTVISKEFRTEQSLKDIDWEMHRKRNRAQQASQQNKKPYTGPPNQLKPQKPQGQPPKGNIPKIDEKPLCKECKRQHYGKCRWVTYKCFKCGELGHKAGDGPKLKQLTAKRV